MKNTNVPRHREITKHKMRMGIQVKWLVKIFPKSRIKKQP